MPFIWLLKTSEKTLNPSIATPDNQDCKNVILEALLLFSLNEQWQICKCSYIQNQPEWKVVAHTKRLETDSRANFFEKDCIPVYNWYSAKSMTPQDLSQKKGADNNEIFGGFLEESVMSAWPRSTMHQAQVRNIPLLLFLVHCCRFHSNGIPFRL